MVDWEFFRIAADDDETVMAELIGLFLSSYERRLADVDAACAKADAKALHHAAHALKGGVAVFGAAEAVAVAEALEQAGASGRAGAAQAEATTLRSLLVRVSQELATFKAGG